MSILDSLIERQRPRLETAGTATGVTTTTIGCAIQDSVDGIVYVELPGAIIPGENLDGTTSATVPQTAVPLPCINPCKAGDSVYVSLTGNEVIKTPYVIGPVGSGDKMASDISTAQTTADNAATAASNAQTTADGAVTAAGAAQTQASNAATAAANAASAAAAANTAAGNAQTTADGAATAASNAATAASNAQTTATTASNAITSHQQYFWHDANGAHIASAEGDGDTGLNLLLASTGVFQRNGTNILSAQTSQGFDVYDGSGNNAANIVAHFGVTSFIGATTKQQLVLDQYAVSMVDNTGTSPVTVFHLGKDSANGSNYYTFGARNASGAIGQDSTSIGLGNTASGQDAVAIGGSNVASGDGAVAFGADNHASGVYAAAFGHANYATGDYSVAAGEGSAAGADNTLVFGRGLSTNANAIQGQVVVGRYNATSNSSVFIVGCGDGNNTRANALTVSQQGALAGITGDIRQEKVLWSGTTKTSWAGSTATLQLNETAANFSAIEIFYCTNDTTPIYDSVKITEPNGKLCSVSTANIWSAGAGGAIKAMTLSINGTTVSAYNSGSGNWRGQMQIEPTGYSVAGGNYIYLTKIVGYK